MDLSEQLRTRRAAGAAPASTAGSQQVLDPKTGSRSASASKAEQQRALFRRGRANPSFANNPPSKGEARRWERNNRFAKRVRAFRL